MLLSKENDTAALTPVGASHFVSMTRGQLPLVLSAPHGGTEAPDCIPDLRGGPYVSDKYTMDLVKELVPLIGREMGGREPFAVYNKLHRSKMDANRDLHEGTDGGLYATSVHDLYHDTLQQCVDEAKLFADEITNQVLLIDIHGYAPLKAWNTSTWDSSWIMVGHLVSRKKLRSVKRLTNEDWVRGPASIGSLFQSEGLMAEPSTQRPVPNAGKYFSGGYITERYRTTTTTTTNDDDDDDITTKVQTIQLELPMPMRDDLANVAPRMAKAIAKLMYHWEMASHDDDHELDNEEHYQPHEHSSEEKTMEDDNHAKFRNHHNHHRHPNEMYIQPNSRDLKTGLTYSML